MEDFEPDFNKAAPHPADADPELKDLMLQIDAAKKALNLQLEAEIWEKAIARAKVLYGSENDTPSIMYYVYGEVLNGLGQVERAADVLRQAIASYDNEPANLFLIGAIIDLQIEVLNLLGLQAEIETLKARPDFLEANALQWGVE